jgi:hypothetical protein
MVILKLWSDDHRRTPVDIFVYEPFDFSKEYGHRFEEKLIPSAILSWHDGERQIVAIANPGNPRRPLGQDRREACVTSSDPARLRSWRRSLCE